MDWVADFFDTHYSDEYFAYATDQERTEREAEFIFNQLQLTQKSHVLDLACGNGRHCLALAPQVARVTGFDRTQAFIDAALEARGHLGAENVELVVGDMRELEYESEFDAVVNYFTAWGYYSDEENFDVLKRVRKALKPGGRFLLETLNREAMLRNYRPQGYTKRDDGSYMLEQRRFDLQSGRNFNIRTTISAEGAIEEHHFDHYMPTPDGMIRHLKDAGFSEVYAVEAPTGDELKLDSWRMAVIGTR